MSDINDIVSKIKDSGAGLDVIAVEKIQCCKYDGKDRKDLVAEAKKRCIHVTTRMKKKEIVDKLIDNDKSKEIVVEEEIVAEAIENIDQVEQSEIEVPETKEGYAQEIVIEEETSIEAMEVVNQSEIKENDTPKTELPFRLIRGIDYIFCMKCEEFKEEVVDKNKRRFCGRCGSKMVLKNYTGE